VKPLTSDQLSAVSQGVLKNPEAQKALARLKKDGFDLGRPGLSFAKIMICF
jgi:hypothetical protein